MPPGIHTPDSIAAQVAQWRPLPSLLFEVLDLRWPEPDVVPRLAAIIDADPDLARRLRVMGSTSARLHGDGGLDVMHAVAQVGFRPVHSGVIAALVIDTLAATSNTIDFLTYWRRAAACATLASTLADRQRAGGREHAYPAGLLHQAGLLALDMAAPDALKELRDAIAEDGWAPSLEESVLGFTVGEVTAALHVRWKLPLDLAETHLVVGRPEMWNTRPVARVVWQAIEALDALGIEDPIRGTPPPGNVPPDAAYVLERFFGGGDGLIAHSENLIAACMLAPQATAGDPLVGA